MKNIVVIICSVWLLFTFLSCGGGATNEGEGELISFDGAKKIRLDQQAIDCVFLLLETTEDALLGTINKIEIVGDRIFILDAVVNKSLYVYSLQGEYITQVGKRGDGPGEYHSANNFQVDTLSGQLTIEDKVLGKILSYDLYSYQYQSTKRIPFHFSAYIKDHKGDNLLFYKQGGYDNGEELFHIKVTDSLFQDINYHHPASISSSFGFYSIEPFYVWNEKIHFYYSYFPFIYEISQGEMIKKYKLDLGSHQFPPLEYMQNITKNDQNFIRELLFSGYVADYSVMENETYFTLSYLLNNETFIGLYNKETDESYLSSHAEFMNHTQLKGITSFVGKYNDYFLTTIRPDALKRLSTSHEELIEIKKKITEEDNPIVCFFKIKE